MAGLIGIIHVAKSQLGMDDDTYRALLLDLTGKDSCSKLTRGEQWQVIEELKRKGFQKKPTHKGKHLISDPQAKKIRALWLTMADCGIVRDRSEKALATCMRRFTGRTLEDASVKQCQAMIEILKQWFDRCDDPKKRAVCLAVLEGDTPPPILDGKLVAEVPHAEASYQ